MSEVFPLTFQMGWTSGSLGIFLLAITTVILVAAKVLGKTKARDAQLNAVRTEWNVADKASYPPVEPLPDFRWQDTEPLKLRPFKPSYNLTMAISKSKVSELVEMDRNYLSRVTLRKQLMATETETILATQDSVNEAVDEFYTWMMGTYLPTRFPLSSKITPDGQRLHNLVTGDMSLLKSPDLPIDALRILGGTIDDDLLFLLPSPDGDGYTLQGFVNCFPGGFDTKAKFNMKLRDIHIPVPSYKEKLEKSMDKFFDRIEVGTFVKRANWSINTNENLFIKVGNHAYADDEEKSEDINPATTFLRCERQCLHRLPKTKALLLSVKTFLYPMSELKAEGFADDLIAAIDGLKIGNAPGMHFYKRAGMWGDSLKAYLKS